MNDSILDGKQVPHWMEYEGGNMTKGICKHGEFELERGCEKCIAELREAKEREQASTHGEVPTLELKTAERLNMEANVGKVGEIEKPAPDAELVHTIPKDLTERPGADRQVLEFYHQACELRKYANERTIKTLEDAQAANNDLTIISQLKKGMEGKRKEYLSPLQAQVKDVQESYKFLMEPVLEADLTTRNKLLDFNKEQARIKAAQEEINRKRIEAAQEEAALNDGEISEPVSLVEVSEAPTKVSTDMGTSGMRDNWVYDITDFALLSDEYKLPNKAALSAIAKSIKGTREIPGLRIYNEQIIAVRASTYNNLI